MKKKKKKDKKGNTIYGLRIRGSGQLITWCY